MQKLDHLTLMQIEENLKVKVIERKMKKGIALHLHCYFEGVRTTKSLKIYLKPVPKHGKLTPAEEKLNNEKRRAAENYRLKYYMECKNEIIRKLTGESANESFFEYFSNQAERKKPKTQKQWNACLKHIMLYHQSSDLYFDQVNEGWLLGFINYLELHARKKNGAPLGQNTQATYLRILKACITSAYHRDLLKTNPGVLVAKIKEIEPEVEFLTEEEVDVIERTKCESPEMKRAFLFSIATGLRWSDIVKLTWGDIRHTEKEGHFIRFRHQKTKTNNTLYIKEDAVEILGKRHEDDKLVIPGIVYSDHNNKKLLRWMLNSGINRHITFHCARHTHATLFIANGGDIYDLKVRLGHSNINTTERYTKALENRKRTALEHAPKVGVKNSTIPISRIPGDQNSFTLKVVRDSHESSDRILNEPSMRISGGRSRSTAT